MRIFCRIVRPKLSSFSEFDRITGNKRLPTPGA